MSMAMAVQIKNLEARVAMLSTVLENLVNEIDAIQAELQRRKGGRPRMNGKDPSHTRVGE